VSRSPDRPGKERARIWGVNALLVLIAIGVGGLVIEGALRFTHYRYLTHPNVRYASGYYQEDPELGVDLAPNRPSAPVLFKGPTFESFTNGLGCFDHNAPIDEGWVLAVGDSWTWGYAALEDKWTTHLEQLSGRRVVKCGISSTGPKHQRLKAEKTIEKVGTNPDLIIVLYDTWNDFNDDAVFPGYAIVHGERVYAVKSLDLRTGDIERHTPEELERRYQQAIRRQGSFSSILLAHSVAAATLDDGLTTLRERWAVPEPPGPLLRGRYPFFLWDVDPVRYPWIERAFEDHVESIRALERMAEAHDAELVLIGNGIPERGLHGRLRRILSAELAHFHDIAESIEQAAQGDRTHYHHDRHWNALGNHLAAKAIYRYLTDAGLLQPPAAERAPEESVRRQRRGGARRRGAAQPRAECGRERVVADKPSLW
jgi:hypothetical protein